jgi:hypothetical protein
VVPRTGLGSSEEDKNLTPAGNQTPDSPSGSPVNIITAGNEKGTSVVGYSHIRGK